MIGWNSYDTTIPCFYKMPEYLANIGYKNPSNPTDAVFQYAKGWKGDLFQYYDTHPRQGKSFNNLMGGVRVHQAGWLDIFPHNTLLDSNPLQPLLVDVGGNVGHDIASGSPIPTQPPACTSKTGLKWCILAISRRRYPQLFPIKKKKKKVLDNKNRESIN